jgi:hypothetical protein
VRSYSFEALFRLNPFRRSLALQDPAVHNGWLAHVAHRQQSIGTFPPRSGRSTRVLGLLEGVCSSLHTSQLAPLPRPTAHPQLASSRPGSHPWAAEDASYLPHRSFEAVGMASHEAAAPRPAPGALGYDTTMQQANSGGFRLAQEFEAKTNLKGFSQESGSPRSKQLQVGPSPAEGRSQPCISQDGRPALAARTSAGSTGSALLLQAPLLGSKQPRGLPAELRVNTTMWQESWHFK